MLLSGKINNKNIKPRLLKQNFTAISLKPHHGWDAAKSPQVALLPSPPWVCLADSGNTVKSMLMTVLVC
jgi:hypothetical protein